MTDTEELETDESDMDLDIDEDTSDEDLDPHMGKRKERRLKSKSQVMIAESDEIGVISRENSQLSYSSGILNASTLVRDSLRLQPLGPLFASSHIDQSFSDGVVDEDNTPV